MTDFQETYYKMCDAKNPRGRYKHSLKLIEHYCEKGEVFNAQHSAYTLTEAHAAEAGLTKQQMEEDINRILQKGYAAAVPKIINEIETTLKENRKKNFRYLEREIETAFDYATQSKAYSLTEIIKINDKLEELREKLTQAKATTPEEDKTDWQVIELKDTPTEIDGYYK